MVVLSPLPRKLRAEVSTHRAGADEPALLRSPVAWLLWPTLGLRRTTRTHDEAGCLLDLPGSFPYRVWHLPAEWVLRRLDAGHTPEQVMRRLARRDATYTDYRTTTHLLDDGWRVV